MRKGLVKKHGEASVFGSEKLFHTFRRGGVGIELAEEILNDVSTIYTQDDIRAAAGPQGIAAVAKVLPRTMRTLKKRAAASITTDEDTNPKRARFSGHEIDANLDECVIELFELGAKLQSILMDFQLKEEPVFLREAGKFEFDYFNKDGEPLFGPQPWQDRRWKKLAKTIKPGQLMLGLIIHSDATFSRNGQRYPFRIQIANFSLDVRMKDASSRIIGLGPVISVLRKRGTTKQASRSEDQTNGKREINQATPAHILADLDEIAATLATVKMRVPRTDGEGLIKGRREVRLRVVAYCGDMEEKWKVCGIAGDGCARCHYLQKAHEGPEEEHPNRPFMRIGGEFTCGAIPRTPMSALKVQARFAQLSRLHGVEIPEELTPSRSGVRSEVEVMLHRLRELFPWTAGGPYGAFAFDLLHTLALGMLQKWNMIIEALFQLYRPVIKVFKTPDDLRKEIDRRLAMVAPFRNFLTFKGGWFEAESTENASASEQEDLCEQYLFVYALDDNLIPAEKRNDIVLLHRLLLNVSKELRNPTWYMEARLQQG
jgi:hypothetical protein